MKLQAVKDDATDQNFREVKGKFPIQAGDVADSVKELFPQLAVKGSRKLNFGTDELEWAGGSITSKTKSIAHGLGKTPAVVVANCIDSGRSVGIGSRDATNFTATLQTLQGDMPAAGTKQMIYWIAIG